MATPRQNIDLGRYFDIEGVRIDTRRMDRALRLVPDILKIELLDAFDHIRRGFFKALYAYTGLHDKRFIATKDVGVGRQLKVYRNPNKGDTLDMEMGIFSRSKIVKELESGGTITAKSGAMAIPLPPALTSSGRLLPELSKVVDYRRAFDPSKPNGIFLRSKNGKLLLERYTYKRGQRGGLGRGFGVEALFILKRSITLEPRLRFYDTWNRMEGYRMNVFNESIDKALDKT
jgi:hypothetical protein